MKTLEQSLTHGARAQINSLALEIKSYDNLDVCALISCGFSYLNHSCSMNQVHTHF
jgi:hypothetical protein